jgi:hypothetical protein
MSKKLAQQKLEEAYRRAVAETGNLPPDVLRLVEMDVREPGLLHYRQTHDGVTQYALAAFQALTTLRAGVELRDTGLRDREAFVSPALVPLLDYQEQKAHAVVITWPINRVRLTLTGLSWGYGGEGPNGFAVILVALGKLDDLRDASRLVSALSRDDYTWEV